MFKVIRASADYGVVVAVLLPSIGEEIADTVASFVDFLLGTKPHTVPPQNVAKTVKYYLYHKDYKDVWQEVDQNEALSYFNGMADGLGFGLLPQEVFASLELLEQWRKEAQLLAQRQIVEKIENNLKAQKENDYQKFLNMFVQKAPHFGITWEKIRWEGFFRAVNCDLKMCGDVLSLRIKAEGYLPTEEQYRQKGVAAFVDTTELLSKIRRQCQLGKWAIMDFDCKVRSESWHLWDEEGENIIGQKGTEFYLILEADLKELSA